MHSSNCFGLAPRLRVRLFRNFMTPSKRYALAVQYAVTRGNFSRSAFPNLAASRRAVGSFILVNCEYTSLPLSSSGPSSPGSGLGNSFNFCAFFVVLCGPIFDAGGSIGGADRGEPWLFLLRSLLLSVESTGCPAEAWLGLDD